jgi:serine/threonine-protein kinase
MPTILVESGPLRGRRFKLPQAQASPAGASGGVVIGRDERCAIRVDDGMASRLHCALVAEGDVWKVRDLGSLNLTYVNDTLVREKVLAVGDVIQVGDTLLSFVSDDEDPLLGATLAGYRIEKRLGRGAMGTVYLATQLSLERPVALKILASRLSSDEEFVRCFIDEARAAGRLNHPNVVQVYDAGRDGERHYISMEFLEGGTLEELLAREGRLLPERAVAMALDAAQALAYAESQHVVHRDIKPANLLLSGDGAVKLGDLGLAKDLRRRGAGGDGKAAGGDSKAAGSPRYMAPEQVWGGDVDQRADVYALGATLYRSIAGVPPIDGPSVKEILQAKLNDDPVPLKDRVPGVSVALSAVVQYMLARDPFKRYPSATQVAEALREALARPVARPAPPKGAATAASRPAAAARAPGGARLARPAASLRAPRRRAQDATTKLVLGTVVCVVLLVVVLVAVSKMSQRDEDRPQVRSGPAEASQPAGESTAQASSAPPRSVPPVASANPGANANATGAAVAAALKEIAQVHAAFSEGRLSFAEAEKRVREVAAQSGSAEIEARAGKSLEAMQQAARESAAPVIAEARPKIEGLIREHRLREAEAELADLGSRLPVTSPALDDLHGLLDAASARACDEAREKVAGFRDQGDLTAARRVVDELAAKLPRSDAKRTEELRSVVEEAENEAAERRGALAALPPVVRTALGLLDFAAAEKALSEATGGQTALEESVAPLRLEVELAQAAWKRLAEAVDVKVKGREALALSLAAPSLLPILPPGARSTEDDGAHRYRLLSLAGEGLRIQTAAGKPSQQVISVLALDARSLVALAAQPGAPATPALKEGLGILLALRRGPEPAKALLLDAEVTDKRRGEACLAEAKKLWRRVWLEALKLREERFAAEASGVSAEDWSWQANEAAELISAWRGEAGYSAVRKDLHKLFLGAREKSLALAPVQTLFHAKEVKVQKDLTVVLAYDFSSRDELLDFHPVGASAAATMGWEKSKKLLKLSGEVRLLRGNPFRGRLAVQGIVPALGYDAQRPNINVALWTHERDEVTAFRGGQLGNLRDWGRGDNRGPAPADYFVCALGYRSNLDLANLQDDRGGPPGGRGGPGGDFGRFLGGLRFLPVYLRETSHALLACRRGDTLHRTPQELIWASEIQNPMKGPVTVEIEFKDTSLEWRLNRRPLGFRESVELARLGEKAPHEGSATLFTNGHTVYFQTIEVAGQLAPDWQAARARETAREELALLDADRTSGPGPEDSPPAKTSQ